jgi:hypothetical protein
VTIDHNEGVVYPPVPDRRHLQAVPEGPRQPSGIRIVGGRPADTPAAATEYSGEPDDPRGRDTRPGVGEPGTMLKSLLREKHIQKHSTFRREYDKAAARIDPALVGCAPGKAQFYRWLSGQGMKRMPYPDHCRVLEAMLPGWTVEQMFAPAEPAPPQRPGPDTAPRLPLPEFRNIDAPGEGACDETRGAAPAPLDTEDQRYWGWGQPVAVPPDIDHRAGTVATRSADSGHPVSGDTADSSDLSGQVADDEIPRLLTSAQLKEQMRALMTWIDQTAPIKERDPRSLPEPDRRRDR